MDFGDLSDNPFSVERTTPRRTTRKAVISAGKFLLLVAILKHWGYPLLIMTTIPLGIAGGIVGLAALNLFGSLLGWIGLGGLHKLVTHSTYPWKAKQSDNRRIDVSRRRRG